MDIIKKIVKILLEAFVLWIVAILTTLFASMVNIAFIWIIALIIDIALFLYLIIYILYTLSSKFRNYFDITIEKTILFIICFQDGICPFVIFQSFLPKKQLVLNSFVLLLSTSGKYKLLILEPFLKGEPLTFVLVPKYSKFFN